MIQIGNYTLDDFQERAVIESRREMASGKNRLLLVAPTASGKTVVAMAFIDAALRKQKTVGFITSGRQLIFQTASTAADMQIPHTVLMANSGYEYDERSSFQIISKDSLESRLKRAKDFIAPDLMIVDEADISHSTAWVNIISKSDYVIGLTATPVNGMGKPIVGPFYNGFVVAACYSELIQSGRLVDIPEGNVFSPYRPDLTGVGSQAGDFSTSQLSKRMNQDKLVGDIVSEWKKRANGEPTVVHCVDSAHTIGVCEEFSGQGVNAEYILQDTTQDEREAIFSSLRDGKIQVVTNCQTLTRGWDEPCVSVCVLAKPTKRLRTYLQMVGRVLRSHPGKESAKLIDHSGAVFRHGWPTEDRDWSTEDGEAIEEAESKRKNTREPYCCPKCSALWVKGTECPNCGFKQIKRGQLAVNEAGELVKVKKKQIRKARDKNDPQVLWMKILAQSAYGRKPYRVAAARFKHTFGEWPENAGVGPNASFSQRNMLVRDLWPKFIRGKK